MKKLIFILFSFTLFWSPTILADELDSELIKELKTFYVDSCKGDLMDAFGSNEEDEFIVMCECIFDSIMNAGLTKEELFDTNGMYEVYQARAKGTNEGFTEIEAKIVDIQMESICSCM